MLKTLLLFFYSLGKSSKTVAKDKGKKKKNCYRKAIFPP